METVVPQGVVAVQTLTNLMNVCIKKLKSEQLPVSMLPLRASLAESIK
jgi:hypothetical protein